MDPRLLAIAALLLSGTAFAAADSSSLNDPRLDPTAAEAGYVGSAVCGECHAKEMALWRGSDHDLAIALASEESVLGDFNDAEITAHGVISKFFRRDGGFWVRTDGPLGELQDYPIAYTFGWRPLQQYLIELPGGRLQSLGLAWDSRPESEGGQRWFHLYPNESMDHDNPLHWTAPDQTWNYQCADCHSTALTKGYDPDAETYSTRYAEIDVACEACHGPGARHTEMARAAAAGKGDEAQLSDSTMGLTVDLKDRDGGTWGIDPETLRPQRSLPRASQAQTQVCAPCHSRRGRIWNELVPGASLHDGFRLALLDPGLYFEDGQIRDEVYVYGSFIQSRMFEKGVICSDCHDPHSLRLRAEGNGVCASCHVAERYDSTAHHRHQPESTGASCVACHMSQRYYMVNDERADHSMRIPRPDLSVKIGTPNACNRCHRDKDAAWAAAAVADWYPESTHRGPHFGAAFHAADAAEKGAVAGLLALAGDPDQPAMVRASALSRLHAHPSPDVLLTVRRLLGDPDPLVRSQAVRLLDRADLRTRTELAWPLLADPVRIVRLEAARVLAPLMGQTMGEKLRDQLVAGLEELVRSEMVNADRPEAHLNLGLLAASTGDAQVAEGAYRKAIRLDPAFVPGYANLADLYRAMGRESEAEAELRAGLAVAPDSADLHHALGLALVRAGNLDAALPELAQASDLAPDDVRYAYVHAVALDGSGDTAAAIAALARAQKLEPENPDLLSALVEYSVKSKEVGAARDWLGRLSAVAAPNDPTLAHLRPLVDGLEDDSAPAAGESKPAEGE